MLWPLSAAACLMSRAVPSAGQVSPAWKQTCLEKQQVAVVVTEIHKNTVRTGR